MFLEKLSPKFQKNWIALGETFGLKRYHENGPKYEKPSFDLPTTIRYFSISVFPIKRIPCVLSVVSTSALGIDPETEFFNNFFSRYKQNDRIWYEL